MARRSFRTRTAGPRRTSLWIGLDLSVTIPVSSAVLMGVLNAAALALRPFTVVRTRGLLHILSDQAAVTESPSGAFGMMIASDEATTAGAASLPDPLTNSDAPWFVWEPLSLQFNFLTSSGFDADAGHQYMVDSKSMRKVGNNEDIVIVGANSVGNGAIYRFIGRILVKLH